MADTDNDLENPGRCRRGSQEGVAVGPGIIMDGELTEERAAVAVQQADEMVGRTWTLDGADDGEESVRIREDDAMSWTSSDSGSFSDFSMEMPSRRPLTAAGDTTIHYGVSCDECGVSPVRGTRYCSRRIIDYDICQECYEANHKHLVMADAFSEITDGSTRRYLFSRPEGEISHFEDPESMRVTVQNWEGIEKELLHNPKLQNLYIPFRNWGHTEEEEEELMIIKAEERIERIRQAVAHSKQLKVIYMRFMQTPTGDAFRALKALFDGISCNQSIITLAIRGMDAVVSNLLCDSIIRTNKTIRHLLIQSFRRRTTAEASPPGDEESVALLFQSLSETSLHSFVFKGTANLGADCQAAAVAALRTRPNLKRIFAPFPEDGNEELEQIMNDKKRHWMRDWNDPAASNESRLQILDQLLTCKQVEEQDQVAALYYFARSNPGWIGSGVGVALTTTGGVETKESDQNAA